MSKFQLQNDYWLLDSYLDNLTRYTSVPTIDYQIREVDTCRREAMAKLDTIRKHPRFPDLAIDGSRDTFKNEVWPILSEYARNWEMAFDGSIIMIDEDWQSQAEDLKKILAMTEDIQVL